MTYLEPIETEFETNEGYKYQKPDRELLDELITKHNDLLKYIAKRDKLERNPWGAYEVES